MNTFLRSGFVATAALLLCHCSGEGPTHEETQFGKTQQAACVTPTPTPMPVVGGTETSENRGIGAVHSSSGMCTATLIRSKVILTAAHCVNTSKPNDYTFTLDGATISYKSDRVHSFGQWCQTCEPGWRTGDIAIIRLTTAVPRSVALPLGLSNRWPERGGTLTVYGYGCTQRGTNNGTGTKRKLSFSFGGTPGASGRQDLCPGDSGGPLFDASRGLIVGTNSGFINGVDYYGDIPRHYQAIFDKMSEWGVAN